MTDLTLDDIIHLHDEIVRKFNITPGIKNKGLLDSIAGRPEQGFYSHTPFPDVYSKCASLMEAMIKWHPFIDGNKRTGLAVASAYMFKNKRVLILPLSAVRFSVQVARNEKNLADITEWVTTLTASSIDEYVEKLGEHSIKPVMNVIRLLNSKNDADNKLGTKIIGEWLAYDIYPEYKMEEDEIIQFLHDLLHMKSISQYFK
jgi:death-on-curing protein